MQWGGVVSGVGRFAHVAILGILALAGGGCSIMPTTGPEIGEIYRSGDTDDPTRLPYALVKITPQVVDTLASYAPRIGTVFPDRRPPREITFGIGDSVAVSIFEAAAGLFRASLSSACGQL